MGEAREWRSDPVLWPRSPEQPAWTVNVTWQLGETGRAVPIAVELRALHGQPVTAEAWRSVRVGDVLAQARERLQVRHRLLADLAELRLLPSEQLQHLQRITPGAVDTSRATLHALREQEAPKRGRPPQYGDDHYQRVAAVYLAAVAATDPKPVRAVARAMGATGPNDHRPKAWVREARRRGLIADAGQMPKPDTEETP